MSHTCAPHVRCQDRPELIAVFMMEADTNLNPWFELENAMFAAVGDSIHSKTFELVRLTPDAEGIEK